MSKVESHSGFSAARGISFVLLVGLVLISICLAPHQEFAQHPKLSSLANELIELLPKIGDAFLIAGILALVVDQGIKLKLVEEVVRAASPYLIGRHLPDPVRKSLLGYFTINFVRPQWEIDYEITPLDGFLGFVKVATRVKGVIVNYSDNPQTLPFVTAVDPPLIAEKYGTPAITRVSMAEEYGPKIFDLTPPPGQFSYKQEVQAKPQIRYITVVESTEFLPESYFQPLFTATTVVNTTLRVRYDIERLKVRLELPSDSNPVPNAEANQWGCEWNFQAPLLPGQCILLYWYPKEDSAATAATLVEKFS